MSTAESNPIPRKFPVLRFRNSQIVLGWRVWLILVLALAIVALGILTSPANTGMGVAVGVASILGAVLGAMFQITPLPPDFTAEGASAVRGLLRVVEDVENATTAATQLVDAKDDPSRIGIGLVDIQNRLLSVNQSLYIAMGEWDSVAPGSLDEVTRLRRRGTEALKRLSEEETR